jgi:hypothetical protein
MANSSLTSNLRPGAGHSDERSRSRSDARGGHPRGAHRQCGHPAAQETGLLA